MPAGQMHARLPRLKTKTMGESWTGSSCSNCAASEGDVEGLTPAALALVAVPLFIRAHRWVHRYCVSSASSPPACTRFARICTSTKACDPGAAGGALPSTLRGVAWRVAYSSLQVRSRMR